MMDPALNCISVLAALSVGVVSPELDSSSSEDNTQSIGIGRGMLMVVASSMRFVCQKFVELELA